jgi:hypothetical protein
MCKAVKAASSLSDHASFKGLFTIVVEKWLGKPGRGFVQTFKGAFNRGDR